jgi:replication factor C small subunit
MTNPITAIPKQFVWTEAYRPQTVEDTILPTRLKEPLQAIVKSGNIPNMIFSGSAGVGKTTVARALCKEMGLDYILINGSKEGNIDTLRGKIQQFASTVSLSGGCKVVILDEADYMNPQSTQPALRGFMEEFADNCRFILTCNFRNRIIEPLHSRTTMLDFNINKKELGVMASQFFARVKRILEIENIEYEVPLVARIISKHAPDWRRCLNELQAHAIAGPIVAGRLGTPDVDASADSYSELFSALKAKDFKRMRGWVVNHQDIDSATIYRAVYDSMYQLVQPMSVGQMVLILADYSYKESFVADRELNMVACMTEIMMGVTFL